MIPEVVFVLGAIAGAFAYHLLIAPRLTKACRTAIQGAEESMAATDGIRKDLDTIQHELALELDHCRKMRQEMKVHIADAEELSRVTGILSYAWPGQADLIIFSRTSECCRGVDPTGTAPLVRLQDLFTKIPDLAAFTQELRAGVQCAPEDTRGAAAKNQIDQAG